MTRVCDRQERKFLLLTNAPYQNMNGLNTGITSVAALPVDYQYPFHFLLASQELQFCLGKLYLTKNIQPSS